MDGERRESQVRRLEECLREVVTGRIGNRQWLFFELSRRWPELVGSRVADHAVPAWVRGEAIWIYVDGPAWMQELSLMKQDLLEKIVRSVPDLGIRDIRWLQRPIERSMPEEQPPAEKEIDPDQERDFSALLGIVRDSGCQQALFRLWQTVKRRQQES